MAEAVALSMCRRLDQIDFPRRYAFTALTGKLQEWYRAHPAVEVLFDPDEFERQSAKSGTSWSADVHVLFSEIRARLSERDRAILVLLEQDLGPKEIAKALEISYSAAAKGIQRTRERMSEIISEARHVGKKPETTSRPRAFNLRIW
jgi:DNA-directed RNA polymerase specialized sigma24 family protein